MFFLLAGGAAASVIPMESTGFHTLTLSKSDIVSFDLTDSLAVFLDVPLDSFTAEFRTSTSSIPAFFPVSVSAFTIHGGLLQLVCRALRLHIHLWLISADHCPDAGNIAIVNTAGQLLLETGLNGTICLFFHFGAYLYDVRVETGYGFPWISFFSSRGRGDVIRLCQGEEDPCVLAAPDLLFMSLRGPTRINFSYAAHGFGLKGFRCSIEGMPMVVNGSFVDTRPLIDNIAHPWCLSESNGLVQAGRVMILIGIALAGCGLVARIVVRSEPFKGNAFVAGWLAVRLRRSFETC
jgi:hypothetical protein